MYDLLEERRIALEHWGDLLTTAVEQERNSRGEEITNSVTDSHQYNVFAVAAEYQSLILEPSRTSELERFRSNHEYLVLSNEAPSRPI